MERKIIGYKLLSEFEAYRDAALLICGIGVFRLKEDGTHFAKGSIACDRLTKAGVLDLWFDIVYEEHSEIIDMGSFTLTIKDNRVYHKNEDITAFVSNLVKHFYGARKIYGYEVFTDNDITFLKTGCETSETKLSDWKKIFDKLN